MTHTKRDNYKAKWLASLPSSVQTSTDIAHDAQSSLNTVTHAQVNTAIELVKAKNAMIEATKSAKLLAELMDECRDVGDMDFGETIHAIDNSITSMNIIVMARRMRDVMRIAEARIGFLTALVDDQHKAISSLKDNIKSLHTPTVELQKSAIEALIIGSNPSMVELDDLDEKYSSGEYLRFGLHYEPMDDELITSQITSKQRSLTHGSDSMAKHSRTDSGVSLQTMTTVPKNSNGKRNSKRTNDVEL
jgi:hypothetical protein